MRKIVHQIWLNDESLPAHCIRWTDEWAASADEYHLWDMENARDMLPLWLADNIMDAYIQAGRRTYGYQVVSDLLRLEVIHQDSGLYVDLDNRILKDPWERLERDNSNRIAVCEGRRFPVSNSFLWSPHKNVGFWKRLQEVGIAAAERLVPGDPVPPPFNIAGPPKLSEMLPNHTTVLLRPFLWFEWENARDGRTPPAQAYISNAPWWRVPKVAKKMLGNGVG